MTQEQNQINNSDEPSRKSQQKGVVSDVTPRPSKEIGGPPGPEPTRYGDWERKGRCIDF